jgi:radical SAM-linked protein
VINKNVSEADILAAAEEAFRSGRTTLKLYFMIGLPREMDADAAAIADLCLDVRRLGKSMLGPKAGRLQLNVSVNNFVPKPFTPFQWAGMAEREVLLRRQDLLRSRLRVRGVRLALHDIDKSYLEAVLARGGPEMAGVVEDAWRRGARFDSWTEQFRAEAWEQALTAHIGSSAEELATGYIPRGAPLPWDGIEGVIDRDFLWAEWERARGGQITPDCRWEECGGCGVCSDTLGNDLAAGSAQAPRASGRPHHRLAGGGVGARAVDAPSREGTPRRFVLTFSVTGRSRFVGHLDRAEVLRRTVRRAGGSLALSAGMRPKPQLSLALPLAVGTEGLGELCQFELAGEPPPSFCARLGDLLPADMALLALEPYDHARSLPARVVGAAYEVRVRFAPGRPTLPQGPDPQLVQAAGLFVRLPELMVEDEREGRVRRIDVKTYVDRLQVEVLDGQVHLLSFTARVTPAGTVRPEWVVKALSELAGLELEIEMVTRTRIELS